MHAPANVGVSRASDPADRRARAKRLDGARRRADAADALFLDGRRAAALELLVQAFDDALGVADERLHVHRLAKHGLSLRELRALSAAAGAHPRPAHDARFGGADERLYRRLLVATRRLEGALRDALAGGVARVRRNRARLGVALAAILACAAIPLAPEIPRIRVDASDQWSRLERLPEHAVDGDPDTEWHLPNLTPGWLEVRVDPPADIGQLRLMNGHDARFGDRACGHVVVELYRRGERLGAWDHRWTAIETEPRWTALDVHQARVDRVVVRVRSWHGRGGALAEIDW